MRIDIKTLATRTITALVLIAMLAACIILHGTVIIVVVCVASLLTQYEMIKTVKASGVSPIAPVLYAFTLLIYPAYHFYGLTGVFVLQAFAVAALFATGIIFGKYTFESIFTSIFMLYYPQLFFAFFYMIIDLPDVELSRLIIIVTFAAACFTDIFAYLVGSFMGGKTPLCPRVSPKKTVEGAIGGLCGGVIAVLVAAILFDNGRLRLIQYALFAVIVSAFSMIGDLAASTVKRRYNVKDFGSILPGHGGIMDRLDSTLFILPMVYLFYKISLGF